MSALYVGTLGGHVLFEINIRVYLFRSDILRSILKWIQNSKTKKFTHKNKTYAGAQVSTHQTRIDCYCLCKVYGLTQR